MSIEEATIPNMWEIAAIEEWAQGYPPGRGTFFGVFHPTPVPLPLRVETGNLKLKNLIPLLGGGVSSEVILYKGAGAHLSDWSEENEPLVDGAHRVSDRPSA